MTETMTVNQTTSKKGIPGSTLKLIAIITMFIDHTGAVILERMPMEHGILVLDVIFRLIGRLGFPIFCFLLIEGFMHTRNVWKYAFRLLLFAFISELPFNLAFMGSLFYKNYQNVFFTLFLGLCALITIKFIEEKFSQKAWLKYLLIIPATIVFMVIANLLKTDYSEMGVLTIVVMYLLRKNKVLEMTAGCIILNIMSLTEITAFFTIIPVSKYNGERGLNFYPVHLLILYFIAYLMGIA